MEFEHFNDSEIKVWCVKNIAENAFCPFRSFWSLKPRSFQVSYNPVSFPVLISIPRYFYHLSPLVPLFALRIRFHNLFFFSSLITSQSLEKYHPSTPPSSLHWSINPSSPGSTYCWQLLPLFPYSSPLYTGYLTSFNLDESKRRLYIFFHWVEEKLYWVIPLACFFSSTSLFFASLMKLIWLKVEQFHSSPLVPHFLGNILPACSL